MNGNKKICKFFFPSLTPKFLIRVSLITLFTYLFFGHVCIPFRIQGSSMEPTYHNRGINFCWRLHYLFSEPKRNDVVTIRFTRSRVMLLKRIVALEGERVEFRDGKLLINGNELDEPYIRYPCNWNLLPRQVEVHCVYVIGDNRNMPMENHYFGQTSIRRILGVPLW
jgi:signal peptidase I